MAPAFRSVAEHAAVVAALLARTPTGRLPLQQTRGLALADDVIAAVDLPPFANSAMDGYAVRAVELAELPNDAELVVSQDIPAGRTDVQPLQPGTVARIMTGAPIPDGADAVIPVEQISVVTSPVELIRIDTRVEPGKHVRGRGSDVGVGAVVLPAGSVVGPPQIGLLAALGESTAVVHRPLRVLLLSTGDELVAAGSPLLSGQIYESNSPMLAAAVSAIGGEPTVAHFVSDDVDAFRASFAEAAAGMDLVVTSGGVSAGAFEVVKDALSGRGVEFVKVGMQPGMPQGAGVVRLDGGGAVPVVTLPGNPVSSFVSFEVFLRPAMLAAMGHPAAHRHRPSSLLPLSEPITSVPGKRQFRRGVVDREAGTVRPYGGPGSHLLGWLAGADSLLVIPEDVTELPAGAAVEVWDLTG
ncbi:molybdopterin molybdotransferase MoeA [Nakamurella lactea]|uniref:molybdopterin molybdotransferase MoeA n=1 Tax=Nakamurella lactea TaxID=459515 RepID=UPI0003FD8F06|nr:gephyrin-like molybdotransferase Glp [Nakamurella lactea]